jgi:fumarylacetoacetate (FAA) hydrolase
MKLATLNDGSRDGQLAVVSRDLKTVHVADGIAPTLQAALDDWAFIAPQLQALYTELNAGRARRSAVFDPARCMAPLPRAFAALDSPAYPSYLERLGNAVPAPDEPLLRRIAGDGFLGPHDPIALAHEAWGIDCGAGLAVVTGDVAAGATPDQASGQLRLLLLTNAVSLRNLDTSVHARPATACAPVAVTQDEFGGAWRDAKVHLPLRMAVNGRPTGQPHAGTDMAYHFAQLLAHLCRTRPAHAGTIVGAGPVSNRDTARGVASIAEQRAIEMRDMGAPVTSWLRFGDTVRIEMLDEAGKSVFGAIEQEIVQRS